MRPQPLHNRAVFNVESREVFERLHHLAPPLERVELERATAEGMPEPFEGTTTETAPGADERD